MIKEYTEEAEELKSAFGIVLNMLTRLFKIEFKAPMHDIANALLYQVKGFEPMHGINGGQLGDR